MYFYRNYVEMFIPKILKIKDHLWHITYNSEILYARYMRYLKRNRKKKRSDRQKTRKFPSFDDTAALSYWKLHPPLKYCV